MSRARFYPKANRTVQWFGDTYPGTIMPTVEKLLWHSTETAGWPSYDGGAKAPTLTYHPGLHAWRQHFRIDQSARALRDPSGTPVRENRDGVVQVEICAYAELGKHPHVAELDNRALDDLAAFAAWLHTEWDLRLINAPLWLPYPKSYGNSAARMTSAEFDAFKGICGHMHASGNDHGDPGALNVASILSKARSLSNPTPPPPTGDLTMADAASIERQINALAETLGLRYDVDSGRYQQYAKWNAAEVERDQADAQRDATEMGLLSQLGAQLTATRAEVSQVRGELNQIAATLTRLETAIGGLT